MKTTSTSPLAASNQVLHSLQGESMGTSWCVKLVAARRADLHGLHAGIQSQLDEVVAQMSTWETESDISRFNRLPPDTWQALPAAFFQVLSCAMQIAHASGGAYDPTIGPLVQAWGFGANSVAPAVPAAATLHVAQARVGWQEVLLRHADASALQPGGFQLDLSAIAKGYAVDAVSQHLRGLGISAALVEVGGELYGYGAKPDGTPWQVRVETTPDENQDDAANPARVIALDGLAIATSGDHWHSFEYDSARYAHTLDPRTGKPVQHAPAAVTVIADDAMHADAWATALTVMGGQAGYEFAQSRQLAARFVMRAQAGLQERMTDAFNKHLPA